MNRLIILFTVCIMLVGCGGIVDKNLFSNAEKTCSEFGGLSFINLQVETEVVCNDGTKFVVVNFKK